MSNTLKIIDDIKHLINNKRRELNTQKRVFDAEQALSYREIDTMERWIGTIEEEVKKELNQEEK